MRSPHDDTQCCLDIKHCNFIVLSAFFGFSDAIKMGPWLSNHEKYSQPVRYVFVKWLFWDVSVIFCSDCSNSKWNWPDWTSKKKGLTRFDKWVSPFEVKFQLLGSSREVLGPGKTEELYSPRCGQSPKRWHVVIFCVFVWLALACRNMVKSSHDIKSYPNVSLIIDATSFL
jgi:hypothetical protein